MREYHSQSIREATSHLDELDPRHTELGTQLAHAYGGRLYGLDLLTYAALNRSKSNLTAFRSLVGAQNLMAAGPFVRMQLDTALRFYATSLVDDPHGLVMSMLDGKSIRDMRDRDGCRLTDRYLVDSLEPEFPWIARVYERGSGYVHLSGVHLHGALSLDPDPDDPAFRRFEARVSDMSRPLPERLWVEMVDAYCSITDLFFDLVVAWIRQKNDSDPNGDAEQAFRPDKAP